jgi:RimJ/RimL family protein N-acetyltransferase
MPIELLQASFSHQDAYAALFSPEAVCRLTDIVRFQTADDAKRFLEIADERRRAGKSLRYSIAVDGEIVGTISLYGIDAAQRRASVGYALAERYWGRGIMTEALARLVAIAKNQLNLNRLQATILPENSSSRRVLEKAGFEREGLLRQYEFWEGRGFVDLEMYGKLL